MTKQLKEFFPNFTVFKNESFSKLWLAQIVSECGNHLNYIALMTFLYNKTHNLLNVSLLLIIKAITRIIFSPISGAITDKYNKKNIILITDLVRGFIIILLIISFNVISIYILILILTIMEVLFRPAMSTILPELVTDKNLYKANSVISVTFDFISVIAPIVGGAIVSLSGYVCALSIDSATFFISFFIILFVKYKNNNNKIKDKDKDNYNFKYKFNIILKEIINNKIIFLLIVINTMLMLCGGALNVLLVPISNEMGKKMSLNLGSLFSAIGIGFLFGSVLLNIKFICDINEKVKIIIGLILMFIPIILWGLFSKIWYISLLAGFINGAGNTIFGVNSETLFILNSPKSRRGLYYGIANTFSNISNLISLSCVGILFSLMKLKYVLYLLALIMLITISFAFQINQNLNSDKVNELE